MLVPAAFDSGCCDTAKSGTLRLIRGYTRAGCLWYILSRVNAALQNMLGNDPAMTANDLITQGKAQMRICYVANAGSVHTQRWVNYFASRAHDVHLISWAQMPGGHERIQTHLLTRLPPRTCMVSRYLSAVLWVFQTRHLIGRIKPDIVDGHYITVSGFLAACSGFHPLIVTAWGSDLLVAPAQRRLSGLTARFALRKADRIVSLFPVDFAREVYTSLGAHPDQIRTILLGVDTGEFSPTHRAEKNRQGLGADTSQPMVMSTRKLAPLYDIETLVKAIPLVLAEVPQARFVIAGTGEQEPSLKELARSLGVLDRTQFTGWLPRAELPRYLASADVYVSTSLSDGASNSLLEGMACGLAPVVTDIPANRPWVKDGANGFLFPAGDHKTLAARIIALLKDRQMREAFGRTSRKIVQEEAEEETQMAKLERLYHELVEAKSDGIQRRTRTDTG